VKLGDFWLQHDNGWGQRLYADRMTRAQATEVARQLVARSIMATVVEDDARVMHGADA